MKKLLFVALTATLLIAAHSWSGYHWASSNLSPKVTNRATDLLYNVPAGVTEWSALGTPVQPIMGDRGKIVVKEASNVFWLGLARIFVEDGHITKGEVYLNTRLLQDYGADAADHVLCQEIGHILGLDHNRDALDTCMNDQAPLGSVTTPNAHDAEQLNAIYSHTDATGGGRGSGKKGHETEGVWIVVHIFEVPE